MQAFTVGVFDFDDPISRSLVWPPAQEWSGGTTLSTLLGGIQAELLLHPIRKKSLQAGQDQ